MNIGIRLSLLILAIMPLATADENMSTTFERLKAGLKPIDLESSTAPEETKAYLKFYSLAFADVNHSIGTIRSGTHSLAVQVFQPKEPKGTVILSHGYYDHAGVLKHLIRHFVEEDYVVAVIDHIGHGLSTGDPAAIGNFTEYIDGLNQLVQLCHEQLPGPLHLVGHSMGCAIILDSLLTGKELAVDRVLLLAPLVRSKGWKASGVGLKLLGGKLASVPRKFRRNSSDDTFLAFHKADPLQAKTVPMSWVNAHRKWYDRMQPTKTNQKAVTIIQGTKDTTVDWEHNLKFLKERLPNGEVVMINEGGHQLMNESPKIRQTVLKKILDIVKSPKQEIGVSEIE